MSIGTPHARPNRATPEKLAALRNTASFRRMWARPFKVDVTHQVPDTSGFNVLGTVYYIDSDFYAAVMSGKIQIPNMTPKAIVTAVLICDRTEKCILDADNDVAEYLGTEDREAGAHEFGTLAEHEFVRRVNVTPRAYEAGLRQILELNEHKPITNPPADLDCEPYVDQLDDGDKRALAEMKKAGVADAGKVSKVSVNYSRSTGEDRCVRCASWMGQPTSELAPCKKVSGAVRTEFWCKEYELAEHGDVQKDEARSAPVQQSIDQAAAPAGTQAAPGEALHPHIKALVDSAQATQDLVRELAKQRQGPAAAPPESAPAPAAAEQAHVPAAAGNQSPVAPAPSAGPQGPAEALPPPKKKRGKRKITMTKDAEGNTVAEVYEDGKLKRRVKAKRGDDGNLTAEEE